MTLALERPLALRRRTVSRPGVAAAATDFDISQVVDLVKGVHARIRIADFDA